MQFYICRTYWSLAFVMSLWPLGGEVMGMHSGGPKSQNHNIKSLGQRNLEAAIRFYDKDLFQASIKVADELNIAVRGFYHISASAPHWEDGFEEMMFFMDGKRFQSNMFPHMGKIMDKTRQVQHSKLTLGWSSAFEVVDKVNVLFYGSDEQMANMTARYNGMYMSSGLDKINITHVGHSSSSSSSSSSISSSSLKLDTLREHANTLNDLSAYCKEKVQKKQNAFVFYIHNQEACSHNDPLHQSSEFYFQSLDVTDSFLMEYPSVCMSALIGGHATCGVDFTATGYYPNNMFWARCDHIATLDKIDLHSPSFTGHAEHRSLRSNNSKKKQPVDSRTSSSNSDKASPLSAAVTSETSHPLRDYLFNQLTVVPQSAQAAVFGHAGTDSGGDTTGTVTIGKTKHHHKHKDEGFAQRCAYSFSSGGDAQHLSIVDGTASRLGVTAHRCTSRDSFRFKLVEVLSRLHDDGVLINMRDNNTAYAVSDVHLTDHTQHAVHKCT